MFDAIFKLLPEWVLPVLLGVFLWFGANYVFLTGFIAERTTVKACNAFNRDLCQCVARAMVGQERTRLALWSSTFGLYDIAAMPEIQDARRRGIQQCQT
jgi:hypothetical protein